MNTSLSRCVLYLNSTDWYYARKLETGEEVPEEVVQKRLEAREFIRGNETHAKNTTTTLSIQSR